MSSFGIEGSQATMGVRLGEPGLRSVLAATIFVIASFALINLCFVLANYPSTFDIFPRWLIAKADDDSWGAMRVAIKWLQQSQVITVYQEIFFNRQIKFQYPLTSLLPFYFLDHLGIETFTYRINLIGALLQVCGALATGVASLLMMRRIYGHLDTTLTLVALILGITVFVTFYPTMKAYDLGQVQVWINTLFCFAGILWLLDRKFLVGMVIGAICLIKPQFSLFLVWALVRREWGFIAGWATVVILGLAISLYLFGFSNHWDYLAVLQYLSQHGEVYYPNQSINGLINRFLGNGVSQVFVAKEFPPYNQVVYVGTMVTSLLMLALVLFYRPKNGFFDFLIAGLGFTMASPIAWEHHYGILPIYFVALFFAILSLPSYLNRRLLLIVLAVAFVVGGNFYSVLKPLGPGFASLIQSYLLFAAVAVLWLLYRLRDLTSWDKGSLATAKTATDGRASHGL